jgi:hypothetical protein
MSKEPTKELFMARFRFAFIAMVAVAAIPMAAHAGGWAMASFDEVPGEFQAGSTYDLDYTILQHGRTPVDVGSSQVRIIDSSGAAISFDGVPSGQPGRYSVSITFPDAGTWQWEVTMGRFASHPMGTTEVATAAIGSVETGSVLRWLLPAALLLVIGLVATQVAGLVSVRRTGARSPGHPVRAD